MDAKHALMATQTPAIDRGRGELYWLTGLVVISLAIHGVAIVAMRSNDHVDPQPKPKARTLMTMTVAPPRTQTPTPTPPTVAPAAPEAARSAPRTVAKRTARPATAVAPAPEPRAETPADFTGVTLTNDTAGAWATPVGNGNAMNGPVGTTGARVTGRIRSGTTGGAETAVTQGPRTVGLADLSQPPRAPVLSDKLQRNYPEEARSRGAAGKAVVRLRVMPDGHVRDLIVVTESAGGFGDACERTLRDSVWSPPLDHEAEPVATLVSYTCTFEVH